MVLFTTAEFPPRDSGDGDQLSHSKSSQTCVDAVQWHTPVTTQQTLFASFLEPGQQFASALPGEQVLWEGQTFPLNHSCVPERSTCAPSVESVEMVEQSNTSEPPLKVKKKSAIMRISDSQGANKQRTLQKQKRVSSEYDDINPTLLEENAQQVKERFDKGCECQEENCFKGLSPEYVYRHRLNIAELTKGEHDMYLMGVTMAVLANPEETVRHKERQRLRAQYVFQGRRVCLAAFLYLENCTHYQLKRIRKHVMTHGVSPRVHGNHGKKPHNTFPLDSYRHATSFLRYFIDKHAPGSDASVSGTSSSPGSIKNKSKISGKSVPIYLPSDITRKTIHNAYCEYCEHFEPNIKVMGYSTFRHFMKEQFPHVKFCKPENSLNKSSVSAQVPTTIGSTSVKSLDPLSSQRIKLAGDVVSVQVHDNQASSILRPGQITTIPILLSQSDSQQEATTIASGVTQNQQQTTFIVKPVSQILHTSLDATSLPINSTGTFTSYQLTTAHPTYTAHGGQTITVASLDANAQETFAFASL